MAADGSTRCGIIPRLQQVVPDHDSTHEACVAVRAARCSCGGGSSRSENRRPWWSSVRRIRPTAVTAMSPTLPHKNGHAYVCTTVSVLSHAVPACMFTPPCHCVRLYDHTLVSACLDMHMGLSQLQTCLACLSACLNTPVWSCVCVCLVMPCALVAILLLCVCVFIPLRFSELYSTTTCIRHTSTLHHTPYVSRNPLVYSIHSTLHLTPYAIRHTPTPTILNTLHLLTQRTLHLLYTTHSTPNTILHAVYTAISLLTPHTLGLRRTPYAIRLLYTTTHATRTQHRTV